MEWVLSYTQEADLFWHLWYKEEDGDKEFFDTQMCVITDFTNYYKNSFFFHFYIQS